ncbi:MAG TPA: PqqD family protein, partial [Pseudomonadota bacterium]|nr:PqqD family protein [Pseudomonadota bacterium]
MFRNLPSRYAQARLLPTLMLRPSGFLYNTRNAESYTLSPVAACLVQGLQRGEPPDELWREVVRRFEVSEPLAHRDALQFLSTLHQLGLLTLAEAEQEAEDADEDRGAEADAEAEGAADEQAAAGAG